jgi:chromosome segregation ATPase
VKAKLDLERTAVRSTVIAEVELEVRRVKDELEVAQRQRVGVEEEVRRMAEKSQEAQEYGEVLEGRLAEAEALYEKSQRTVEQHKDERERSKGLSRQLEEAQRDKEDMLIAFDKERLQFQASLSVAREEGSVLSGQAFEDQKYLMFKTLMDGFNSERRVMEGKYSDMQLLLSQATKDIMYLQQQNEDLNGALNEMAFWEPEITPSKPAAVMHPKPAHAQSHSHSH